MSGGQMARRLGNTRAASGFSLPNLPRMPNARSRGWCWTINNPTGWDTADVEKLIEGAQYVCYGRETGDTGTPHWQGFCYFQERKSFRQLRELLPRAHLEAQRGSCEQAIQYCEKDGDFSEWGQRPRGPKGQKNAWKEVLTLARGGNFQEIEDRYPSIFFRYHAKLFSFRRPESPIILETLENEWWYGPTGSGKSKSLWLRYPNHFQKPLNKWWDGYTGEETVAIEEWSPKNEVTASFLKIWADRYPFSAEIKGGTLQKIRPLRIIVLSNYKPEECFSNEQDLLPIRRRFKVVQFACV